MREREVPEPFVVEPWWGRFGSTALTLLRQIAQRPFDPLPRLILADFLEENGAPARAEFIHLQVQHMILDLIGNQVGDAGAKALAQSPYLQNLAFWAYRTIRLALKVRRRCGIRRICGSVRSSMRRRGENKCRNDFVNSKPRIVK
jgi:uncharacterized protein (TIGR02996 family)